MTPFEKQIIRCVALCVEVDDAQKKLDRASALTAALRLRLEVGAIIDALTAGVRP